MSQGLQRRAPMWAALAVAALLAPGAARADVSVTYSTSSTASQFQVSAPAGSLTDTITFNGQGSTTVTTTADTAVGSFTWTESSGLGGGLGQTPYTLTVTQSVPSNGSGTYSGDLNAFFFFGSGTPYLTFTNTSITIGNETYQLETKNALGGGYSQIAPNADVYLNSQQGSNHSFTLYANVISADPPLSAPEPSTVPIILAGALFGAGAWYRRRRSA